MAGARKVQSMEKKGRTSLFSTSGTERVHSSCLEEEEKEGGGDRDAEAVPSAMMGGKGEKGKGGTKFSIYPNKKEERKKINSFSLLSHKRV